MRLEIQLSFSPVETRGISRTYQDENPISKKTNIKRCGNTRVAILLVTNSLSLMQAAVNMRLRQLHRTALAAAPIA